MRGADFVTDARKELLAEIQYYDEARDGLGRRFLTAVEKASALAVAFPEMGSPAAAGTRKVSVKGFPFWLFYKPSASGIVIFAVVHHSRRPGYWLSRVQEL